MFESFPIIMGALPFLLQGSAATVGIVICAMGLGLILGLSMAVGQILDPLDDMTERLSDVLVTAITALGVQKLAYEISVSVAPPLFSFFLFALSIFIWVTGDRLARLKRTLMQILLIIVIARFCLPISSMANVFLHQHFFADKIADANQELSLVSAHNPEMNR